MRRKIDIENLTFVDEKEVPESRFHKMIADWDSIFGSIPAGKALVIPEATVSYTTVRSSLARCQNKGKFLKLRITIRRGKGEKKNGAIYVLNPAEKEGKK